MAKCPTAPAPPATSTVFPLTWPSANRHQYAVMAGTPRLAPSSSDTPSGSGTAWSCGTRVHSAAVPHRLDHPGTVVMRDLEAVDRPGGGTAAALPVGGVDPGEGHLDQDLPRPGGGPLHLADGQDLGCRAAAVVTGGSHRRPP